MSEKEDILIAGAKMGLAAAIAMARAGSLSLSPGPADDPNAYPYTTPLHPRAEAYIASQREEWPNLPDRQASSLTEGHSENCGCILCLH